MSITPESFPKPFAAEKKVAVAAVSRACALTLSIFNKLNNHDILIKGDKTVVTIGDYSVQALINTILGRAFPSDFIVGEEDSTELRQESNKLLCDRVTELTNKFLTAKLGIDDDVAWSIGPRPETDELMDAIDRGNYIGGRTGRMWTVDPIDGTKHFVLGAQYAVCLALIVDGEVQLGVTGCPNLLVDASKPDGPRGCIFVAVRGQGAEQLPLSGVNPVPLGILSVPPSGLNLIESARPSCAMRALNDRVSSILGITHLPTKLDSQAKYCALARGDGGVDLRMRADIDYKEKIWDHAAGVVLVEEVGGIVTDLKGEPFNFGLGRTLGGIRGLVAAEKVAHSMVLDAIRKLKEEAEETIH